MLTLMSSLLAVLDGQTKRAGELMKDLKGIRDPEYFFILQGTAPCSKIRRKRFIWWGVCAWPASGLRAP
jgi:hypothetical protein